MRTFENTFYQGADFSCATSYQYSCMGLFGIDSTPYTHPVFLFLVFGKRRLGRAKATAEEVGSASGDVPAYRAGEQAESCMWPVS